MPQKIVTDLFTFKEEKKNAREPNVTAKGAREKEVPCRAPTMPGACAPDPGSKRRAESQCLSGATASKRLYAPCVRVVPRGSDARTGECSEALGDCLDEHGRKLLRAFEDFKRETKSLVREGRIYQAVDLVRRGVTGAKLAALDGRRVRVLWPLDAAWYSGVVAVSKCGGPSTSCTVVYEDGTKEDVE